MDIDQDGIPRPADCDDRDPKVGTRVWYRDVDQDGLGAGEKIIACSMPTGATITNTDCDDANASAYPNATELCDTIDNNCNGETDELFKNLGASCGTGACSGGTRICTADKTSTMCSTLNNIGLESCDAIDNDCDGETDETFTDLGTNCGVGACIGGTKVCAINLSSTVCSTSSKSSLEICDTIDNDCDGETDENLLKKFFKDLDKDTYGNTNTIRFGCEALPDEVTVSGDCNDSTSEIHPNVIEICNSIDDNCNGDTDEDVLKKFYADADGDKCAHVSSPGIFDQIILACDAPSGYILGTEQTCSTSIGDCNDQLANVYAGATEFCDGIDNDCNGQTDEPSATDAKMLYADVDQDGYGNLLVTKKSCQTESGWSLSSDDCNDLNKFVHPNTVETCNTIDDDCDKQIDEGVLLTFYPDNDKDGYGTPLNEVLGCTSIIGYVSNNADCNDQKKDVHPNAVELCDNTIDENCDGITDNAAEAILWYLDSDKDGYGTSAVSLYACATPTGYVADKTDCNDLESSTHPNAVEICKDNTDNDCNGITDTDTQVVTWYLDFDQDGFGDAAQTKLDCAQPAGYVKNNSDCNDTNLLIHPNAKEVCNNGVDDNCDNTVNQCVLTGVVKITDANTIQLTGPENQNFAAAVATCDLNGDGSDDLVIGSPATNANQGKVSIYLSPVKNNMAASHEILGLANSMFGTSLACTKSKNISVLAVGSPGDATGGNSAGALYLFKTPLFNAATAADADAKWIGTAQNMEVGVSCITIPDQDNDQLDDFFVGADGYNGGTGAFAGAGFVVSSASLGKEMIQNTLTSFINKTKDELAGTALAAGFLNPDGKLDLVLGAISSDAAATDAGIAYTHLGPIAGLVYTANSNPLYGISPFDHFGHSLCSGFDLTGDTLDDLLIGSPGNGNAQNTGFIQIARWNTQGVNPSFLVTTLESAIGGDRLGYSVSSGHINTDFIGDILVGSPGADDAGFNTGSVFLQYGPILKDGDIRKTANLRIDGDTTSGQLGWLVKIVPDLNGDDIQDLVLVAKSTKPLRKLYVFPGLGF